MSSAPKQAGVTLEEYRDTLRAHCKDHWGWSPIVSFAHEYFSHLGLASLYNRFSGLASTLRLILVYNPSGLRVVPVESGDETPHFQSLEEIKVILERFGTPGDYGQKEMMKLVIYSSLLYR